MDRQMTALRHNTHCDASLKPRTIHVIAIMIADDIIWAKVQHPYLDRFFYALWRRQCRKRVDPELFYKMIADFWMIRFLSERRRQIGPELWKWTSFQFQPAPFTRICSLISNTPDVCSILRSTVLNRT